MVPVAAAVADSCGFSASSNGRTGVIPGHFPALAAFGLFLVAIPGHALIVFNPDNRGRISCIG